MLNILELQNFCQNLTAKKNEGMSISTAEIDTLASSVADFNNNLGLELYTAQEQGRLRLLHTNAPYSVFLANAISIFRSNSQDQAYKDMLVHLNLYAVDFLNDGDIRMTFDAVRSYGMFIINTHDLMEMYFNTAKRDQIINDCFDKLLDRDKLHLTPTDLYVGMKFFVDFFLMIIGTIKIDQNAVICKCYKEVSQDGTTANYLCDGKKIGFKKLDEDSHLSIKLDRFSKGAIRSLSNFGLTDWIYLSVFPHGENSKTVFSPSLGVHRSLTTNEYYELGTI